MAIDRPLLNPIKHAARLITLTTTRLASSSTASEHQGLVVSPPLSPTQAAFANKTFAKPARFVTSVFHARQLPDSKKPEASVQLLVQQKRRAKGLINWGRDRLRL